VRVTVRLFADLRRYAPGDADGPSDLTFDDGVTVADIVAHLGIPRAGEITAGLNGDLAQLDTELHEGDELTLFSPMEGGSRHGYDPRVFRADTTSRAHNEATTSPGRNGSAHGAHPILEGASPAVPGETE
jgi:sulfur carrier protein ThiS